MNAATATWLAGLLAALAAALAVAPTPRARTRSRRTGRPRLLGLAVGSGGVAALLFLKGPQVALAVILLASASAVGGLVAIGRRRAAAEARSDMVVEACEALIGELRAGQPLVTALQHATGVWRDLAPVAVAAHLGADVPTAMRRLGRLPGAETMTEVAAAWQLCASTGSGLTFALEQVLASTRDRQQARRRVCSELSSARATARLIAALPVLTLLAGQGLGGRPWTFLLGTAAGLGCLAAGLTLAFGGLWWLERIAESTMREAR